MNTQTTNRLNELIENSSFEHQEKRSLIRNVNSANYYWEEFRTLLDKVSTDTKEKIEEIIFKDVNGAIYKIIPNKNDSWSEKYPYRIAIGNVETSFTRVSNVHSTFESAMIDFLCIMSKNKDKYQSICKLLDIQTT